jgi:hypothetical protein
VGPFTFAIADSEIDDLKERLARTRWPNPETVPDWSQGVRLENAKSLINYWEREYDWRRFESELNRFRQFLTAIDGLDIFESKSPNAMPLIYLFGPRRVPSLLTRNGAAKPFGRLARVDPSALQDRCPMVACVSKAGPVWFNPVAGDGVGARVANVFVAALEARPHDRKEA